MANNDKGPVIELVKRDSKGLKKHTYMGTVKLIATYYGKKYECKIKVVPPKCDFTVHMFEELGAVNTVGITIKNNSSKEMTVLADGFYSVGGIASFNRDAKLNGNVVIKPGKRKGLIFKLSSESWYDVKSQIVFDVKFENKIYRIIAKVKDCVGGMNFESK